MPWKSVVLKIGEEEGLDDPTITVTITPLTWLPDRVMLDLSRKAISLMSLQSQMSVDDIELTEEEKLLSDDEQEKLIVGRAEAQFNKLERAFDAMRPLVRDFLIHCVTAWTVKDDDGNELPIPKKLVEDSRDGELEKLPLSFVMTIVSAAQEGQTAEIPLKSAPPSADGSPAQEATNVSVMPSTVSNS